jgi:hypothetical protein
MFGKRWYSASFVNQEGKTHLFRVTEWEGEKLLRTFLTVVWPNGRTNPNIHAVENWCEKNQDGLPVDGGAVLIDLHE